MAGSAVVHGGVWGRAWRCSVGSIVVTEDLTVYMH